MERIMLKRSISTTNAYKLEKTIKKGDKIPIVSDTMFLAMINNEKRKQYASYLISLLLDADYEEIYNTIVFQKEKLDKDNYYDKGKTVDFVCRINGEIIGIEMNNNKKDTLSLERNISYAADLYKSGAKMGDRYNYNRVVQININNFSFEGNNKVIERYLITNEEGETLTDKLEFIYIYLPNIKKKSYNEIEKFERLLLVFNESKDKSSKLARGDKIMEEYVKDSVDTSYDDEIIGLYDKEMHDKMMFNSAVDDSRKAGIEEGLKQGEKKKQIEIARNMLKKGMDKETIQELTSLSEEELEKLSK